MSRRSRSRERHHERYSTTDRHSDDYSRYGDDQNKYRDRDDYDRRGTSRRYEDQRSTDTKPRDRSRDRSRYEDSYRNRDRDYDRNRSHDKGKFDRGQPSYDKDRPYGKDEERAHISREEALNLPRSTTQAAHKAEPSSSSPPSEQVSPELTEEVVVLAGQALGKLAVSETCFLSKAEREALAKVRSVKGDKVTTKDLLALTSSLTSGTNVSGEAKSQPSGSQQRSEPKRELNSQHISITDKTVVNTAPAKKKSTLAVLSLAASQNKNLFAASGLAVPALTSITTTTTAPAATGLGAGVSSSREGKEGRDGPVRSKSQERLQMDIKRHYLGSAAIEDSESGRLDKTREKPKSKYQFEWSLTDDTMSKEYDPLYQGKFTKLLGRGHDKLVGENVHKQKVAVNEGALAFVSEEERDRHVTRENRNKVCLICLYSSFTSILILLDSISCCTSDENAPCAHFFSIYLMFSLFLPLSRPSTKQWCRTPDTGATSPSRKWRNVIGEFSGKISRSQPAVPICLVLSASGKRLDSLRTSIYTYHHMITVVLFKTACYSMILMLLRHVPPKHSHPTFFYSSSPYIALSWMPSLLLGIKSPRPSNAHRCLWASLIVILLVSQKLDPEKLPLSCSRCCATSCVSPS